MYKSRPYVHISTEILGKCPGEKSVGIKCCIEMEKVEQKMIQITPYRDTRPKACR
jgi:hypothetical protein